MKKRYIVTMTETSSHTQKVKLKDNRWADYIPLAVDPSWKMFKTRHRAAALAHEWQVMSGRLDLKFTVRKVEVI